MLLHEAFLHLKKTFEILELCSEADLLDHLAGKPLTCVIISFWICMPAMDGFERLEGLRGGPLDLKRLMIIIYCCQSD